MSATMHRFVPKCPGRPSTLPAGHSFTHESRHADDEEPIHAPSKYFAQLTQCCGPAAVQPLGAHTWSHARQAVPDQKCIDGHCDTHTPLASLAFLHSWHSDGLGPSHVTGPPAGCVLHSEEQGRQTQYAFSAQMSLGRLPKYPCGHSLLPATHFPLSSGSVNNRVFTPRHMLHPVAPRMVFAPVQPGGVPFHGTHRSLHFVQMEPGMVASSP